MRNPDFLVGKYMLIFALQYVPSFPAIRLHVELKVKRTNLSLFM